MGQDSNALLNLVTIMLKVLMIVIAVANAGDCLPLEETGRCGIQASLNPVHRNPWTVYLEYLLNGRLTRVRCGGTLIDSRHVITAAHCMKHPRFDTLKVRLGEFDIEHGRDCVDDVCTDPVVIIDVEFITVHHNYDGKENDIAVLTLKESAPYTDFIRPACLPTGDLSEDAIFTAAGWGVIPRTGEYSNVKKSIDLPYFKTEGCQEAFGEKALPKSAFCAGGEAGVDTCSGDSGGPLVWMKERAELWGVISSGSVHCGTDGIPGIYTKVINYMDWLHTVL